MKKPNLKTRITILFALIVSAVMLIAFVLVYNFSGKSMESNITRILVASVEENLQEIDIEKEYDDDDNLIKAGSRYIELDDDFAYEGNNVSLAIYESAGGGKYRVIGGDDINRVFSVNLPFRDGKVQKYTKGAVTHYVYDANIIDNCWLRGITSDASNQQLIASEKRIFSFVFPVILVLAVLITYLMLSRSLAPINSVARMAEEIGKSSDLSRRVDIKPDTSEIEDLTRAFNRMLDKLENSFNVQRQFISDASHELRTPMAVILAQCEYLLEDGQDIEEFIDGITTIDKQGRAMSRIISEILTLSRIENNSDKYEKIELDYSGILKDVAADFAMIGEKNITLESSIEEGIKVLGDENLLVRMINNLVSNAFSYGVENGHIWISLYTEGSDAVLEVKDDGIGIEEKNRDRVFDRFFQVDRYRSADSSGLGLSMVKDIVGWHGGSVELESEMGKGSVFTVRIPLADMGE